MCNEEKTIHHLFLQCPFVRAVWYSSCLEIRTSDINQVPAKKWIVDCIIANNSMEQIRMGFLQSLFTVLWSLWNHRNQVIYQGKMPNPMEVILTSQTLICRYQLQIALYEDEDQKQVSRNHSPQQNRHNEWQLLIKVQAIGKEVSREVVMPMKPKTWKGSQFSQVVLAVEGSLTLLQSRMLW